MPSDPHGGTLSIVASEFSSSRAFYVTGGTLQRDAPSYVPRCADEELFRDVANGCLCYVLTARQMGKSSLMVRTAVRLRAEGDTPVVLDLTEIGQNLTAEQWYKGLLVTTAEQLDLDDELAAFWRARRDLGPMQRWLRALIDVALPRVTGRMVVFVDEIDAVRSLPFPTDEFFAGIRETFNGRAQAPELERLTFCLLGVASPSDLIRDTRTTPFNVGRRIELVDFCDDEAAPLARGLATEPTEGRVLLDRILYWTGGHPYLTQRLCQAVAEDASARDADGVDRICDDLFLSRRARERDDNLLFVRDRMLRSEVDLAELLAHYRRVRSGAFVPDDEASPIVSVLKLSGIARVEGGRLRVRNRIYRHAFDDEWAREAMPAGEVRRQRRAFASGFVRAAGVSLVVLAMMGYLVVDAVRSRGRAEEQQRIAETERETNRRLLYVAHMNLAYQALDRGDYLRVTQILDDEASAPKRGFEYFYLWRLVHAETHIFYGDGPVIDVAVSPDGTRIAGGTRTSIIVWDAASGKEVLRLHSGEDGGGFGIAFSPDGSVITAASADGFFRTFDAASGSLLREVKVDRTVVGAVSVAPNLRTGLPGLATGDAFGRIRLYDQNTGALVRTLDSNEGPVSGTVFSSDGSKLVSGHGPGAIVVWDVASGRRISTLETKRELVWSLAFTADGRSLGVATADGTVSLVDVRTGRRTATLKSAGGLVQVLCFSKDGSKMALSMMGRVEVRDMAGNVLAAHAGHRDQVLDIAFSPDGSTIVSGSIDQTVRTWHATTSTGPNEVIAGHTDSIYSVAFSPDGSRIATASFDGTAALWDQSGHRIRSFEGHKGYVHSVVFSPDGTLLATGSADRTARLWDVATGRLLETIGGFHERIFSIAFAPDGSKIAVGCFDGTLRLWDVASRADLRTIRTDPFGSVESVAFSPDGSIVAAAGESRTVQLFDVATGASRGIIRGHADWINSIAFSPDGTKLATAGSYSDTTVAVWDLATLQPLYRLKGFSGASGFSLSSTMGPTGRANCVKFSPDGLTLAIATTDRTVKLFDVQTGQELCTLRTPHETQIYSLAFSPDSSTLATASEDATVRLWRSAPREAVAEYLETERSQGYAPLFEHGPTGSF